jgi:hypothetical protein
MWLSSELPTARALVPEDMPAVAIIDRRKLIANTMALGRSQAGLVSFRCVRVPTRPPFRALVTETSAGKGGECSIDHVARRPTAGTVIVYAISSKSPRNIQFPYGSSVLESSTAKKERD